MTYDFKILDGNQERVQLEKEMNYLGNEGFAIVQVIDNELTCKIIMQRVLNPGEGAAYSTNGVRHE